MRDVTHLIAQYRECICQLWNAYFHDEAYRETWAIPDAPSAEHFDKLDRFDEISRILFLELVLEKIGQPSNSPTELETRRRLLRVIPNGDAVPIQISRDAENGGYWDHPVSRIGRDADLRFKEFFDWDQIGLLKLQYYRVEIVSFPEHPELAAREALIECSICRVAVG